MRNSTAVSLRLRWSLRGMWCVFCCLVWFTQSSHLAAWCDEWNYSVTKGRVTRCFLTAPAVFVSWKLFQTRRCSFKRNSVKLTLSCEITWLANSANVRGFCVSRGVFSEKKMWRCEEDVKIWRWEGDVNMRRCEDVKMRRCEYVKVRRCEDQMMWRRCEDEEMRRCEEDVKMRRWEDGKIDVKI